jgi:CRISPR system Cascade subunit CasC
MKHLELHIIQSVPVACLNRDDLNSPKTAIFGGVQRSRVSSQSWKRAIRETAKEADESRFKGKRSRRMVYELVRRLEEAKIKSDVAVIIAEHVADIVETLDSKEDGAGFKKIKTLMFFSAAEYDAIVKAVTKDIQTNARAVKDAAEAIKELESESKKDENPKIEKDLENKQKALTTAKNALTKAFNDRAIRDAIKSARLKDAADIALFGRMVANDPSLNVEAASMFSHALSTHKADNEVDFFAAIDDLQEKGESGAGMTSTLEFSSATYYRFAALNLDMLADQDHLADMTKEDRQAVVRAFLEATITAIPKARKNSMNGNTMPAFVLGIVREKGHPVQLINAFEDPVPPRSSQGFTQRSIELLKFEYKKLCDTWGVSATFEGSIPESGMRSLIDGMVSHVH